jgi:hypothetical protein
MEQQTDQQQPSRRVVGKPFPKGVSGNVSGRTGRLSIHADLVAAFKVTHGCDPDTVQAMNIKTAARLIAKAHAPGVDVEQATRCANTVSRLLVSLGLHSKKPSKPKAPGGGLGAILRGDRHG